MDIYAVMVTNDDVYDLKVRGQLFNNTWTNIAFRFEKYIDSQSLPYLNRGGLEVIIQLWMSADTICSESLGGQDLIL